MERPPNGDATAPAAYVAQTKMAGEAQKQAPGPMCKKHGTKGMSYTEDAQFEAGIQEFDKSIELDPPCASSYGHRGIAYGNLGQYKKAIEDYDKAIEF